MGHTSGLQGRLAGCGCHGALSHNKPFRGTKLSTRKPKQSSRVDTQTQCASSVSNVKLPATHKEASQRALDQLRASSSIVNSTYLFCCKQLSNVRQLARSSHCDQPTDEAVLSHSCCAEQLLKSKQCSCAALMSVSSAQDMLWRRKAVS